MAGSLDTFKVQRRGERARCAESDSQLDTAGLLPGWFVEEDRSNWVVHAPHVAGTQRIVAVLALMCIC